MRKTAKGFTLIELLMVLLVLSLLITLAIGAAAKAIKNGRELRADSMREALQLALMQYRSGEEKWPCPLVPDVVDANSDTRAMFSTFDTVEKNAQLFQALIDKGTYLDDAAMLTIVGGRAADKGDRKERVMLGGTRMPLRVAREKYKGARLPLGYLDPGNQDRFIAYKIVFNLVTDEPVVER